MLLQFEPFSSDQYWLAIAVTGAALALSILGFFYYLRLRHIITGTPTSQLRSAAQGFVELEGFCVRTASPIVSPYSGRSCLWYRCRTYKKRKQKKGVSWQRIDNQSSSDWFSLSDTTGESWIDPRGAQIHPSVKKVWFGSTQNPQAHSPDFNQLSFGSGDYRFVEELIITDNPLYAMGHLTTLNREQLRARQVRRWVKQQRRAGSDSLIIDDKGAANAAYFGSSDRINLLHKPRHWGYPFVLSGFSEERTVQRVQVRIAIALLLVILTTWLLIELQQVPIKGAL